MLNYEYKKEHLEVENGGGSLERIKEDYIGPLEITKVILKGGSNGSQSQGLVFNLKDHDDRVTRFNLYINDKQGKEISFNTALLSQIAYLTKVNPSKFEFKLEGKETVLKSFEGKQLGCILSVEQKEYQGKEYFEANLKQVFDVVTNLTVPEGQKGATEPNSYDYWATEFNLPLSFIANVEVAKDKVEEENDEEFPF